MRGANKHFSLFDVFNMLLMLLLCIFTLYPFWYVLIHALNEGGDAVMGGIWLWPRHFTLMNFRYILSYPALLHSLFVSIARSILGPLVFLAVTSLAAYAMAEKHLPGRKAFTIFYMLPLFIGGTMVSNYLVMVNLGLINNFLVYIVPFAYSFFCMVVMRTFFEELPDEIEESARMDGAGQLTIFLRIVLPLAKPMLTALFFFSVVEHWLDFYTTLLYVTNEKLYALQYVLYRIVRDTDNSGILRDIVSSGRVPIYTQGGPRVTAEVLRMAGLVVVTFPMLIVFPFFQKHFTQGVLIGSIKG